MAMTAAPHDLARELDLVVGDLELDLPDATGAAIVRGYTSGTCRNIYCVPA